MEAPPCWSASLLEGGALAVLVVLPVGLVAIEVVEDELPPVELPEAEVVTLEEKGPLPVPVVLAEPNAVLLEEKEEVAPVGPAGLLEVFLEDREVSRADFVELRPVFSLAWGMLLSKLPSRAIEQTRAIPILIDATKSQREGFAF